MKPVLPDPEKIITDVEAHLKQILRRYRRNFFLQQNITPLITFLLPKFDLLLRPFLPNIRFKLAHQLATQQTIYNQKIDQANAQTLTLVSANILQGIQGVGKEAFFCRFWNSIFFEKWPSPWLEKIFAKDLDASLQRIIETGKLDFLALQEVFSADTKAVEYWLMTRDFANFSVSDSWHVFISKYNVSTLLATHKNIQTSAVEMSESVQNLFDQVQKISWGMNLVELVEHNVMVLNLHAPLVAVKRQIFWHKFRLWLQNFWQPRQKLLILGDFNASPQEIKKLLTDITSDIFLFDLPTFQMEKPPVSMKLDNCVFLGFKELPFCAKATTHDIGSDHRALRVELSF